MKKQKSNHEVVRKITLVGILTALTTVLSCIKIPVVGTVTVTLVLPVVVIGAAICGPFVGALLTVIPAIITLSSAESANFLTWSPGGAIATMILKGIFTGLVAGWIYKLLSHKRPLGAVICSAVAAPIVNTGIFLLGCYIFIWDNIIAMAKIAHVGLGTLLLGLALINFVIELFLNIILCPTILRIIQIARKKKFTS